MSKLSRPVKQLTPEQIAERVKKSRSRPAKQISPEQIEQRLKERKNRTHPVKQPKNELQ